MGSNADSDEEMDVGENSSSVSESEGGEGKVYLPGDPLEEGQVLTCDESAYKILHEAQTGAPCLSFDILEYYPTPVSSSKYPMTVYMVAGTQAEDSVANNIIVMKMHNLHPTYDPAASESDESDEEEDEEEAENAEDKKLPSLDYHLTYHKGCVNRIRSLAVDTNNTFLAATWSEFGSVYIWDISNHVLSLNDRKAKLDKQKVPIFTFKGHSTEGYGLDWSSTEKGMLATGDCKGGLHIWRPAEGCSWHVDQRPLVGHLQSVEDIQWSPNEKSVLATCSVDKSIRIWDIRAGALNANKLTVENAHESDVNVINWNRNEPFIVSGGDDGIIHIWDLRQFKSGSPVATLKHHTAPLTTVEWHPEDSSVFASGGADNQICLWDLSVERDPEEETDDIKDIPSQLLFIHQGQKDIKELHWHRKYSGVVVSTAHSGFHIFKTISV